MNQRPLGLFSGVGSVVYCRTLIFRSRNRSHGAVTLLNLFVRQQLLGIARMNDKTLVHDIGAVGERERAFDILLDDEDGHAICF